MAVLNLGLNRLDVGGNYSCSLPLILTYRPHSTDGNLVYLKIHPNKNLIDLLNAIPDNEYHSYEFWIESGGRVRSTNQSGGRGNRHLSKVGKFRKKEFVYIFDSQDVEDLIENDSVPEVLVNKYSCRAGGDDTYVCIRGTIRSHDHNYTSYGIHSNEIKINL